VVLKQRTWITIEFVAFTYTLHKIISLRLIVTYSQNITIFVCHCDWNAKPSAAPPQHASAPPMAHRSLGKGI
jgi:hypothetical protein